MTHGLTQQPLMGDVVGTEFDGWSDELKQEFKDYGMDGWVGSRLLSENDRVRVWEIRLEPGERWHAHRHVLDYFWTAIYAGRCRQHTEDGVTREASYEEGDTRHFTFGEGEYLLHDVENIGESQVIFTTVEHLVSTNAPLPLT
jgi:quercetin dioxygenase-like cupin family protein